MMKHIARQPLRTIIERIKRKAPCTYTYMYDIVQHVAGTSNAIARGSDSDGFEKLRDTGFRLYDYRSKVRHTRGSIFPRAQLRSQMGQKLIRLIRLERPSDEN